MTPDELPPSSYGPPERPWTANKFIQHPTPNVDLPRHTQWVVQCYRSGLEGEDVTVYRRQGGMTIVTLGVEIKTGKKWSTYEIESSTNLEPDPRAQLITLLMAYAPHDFWETLTGPQQWVLEDLRL